MLFYIPKANFTFLYLFIKNAYLFTGKKSQFISLGALRLLKAVSVTVCTSYVQAINELQEESINYLDCSPALS